jgi:hypothetical protein
MGWRMVDATIGRATIRHFTIRPSAVIPANQERLYGFTSARVRFSTMRYRWRLTCLLVIVLFAGCASRPAQDYGRGR